MPKCRGTDGGARPLDPFPTRTSQHSGRDGSRPRMLNRQRTLLYLIETAGGSASRTSLTKWAFLLRFEAASKGGPSFYQFLPYRYGPFSFCLYQEISALVRNGYLEEDSATWRVTDLGRDAADRAPSAVQRDARTLLRRFGKCDSDALIDHVYENWPEFTVNSELRQLATRPDTTPAVYTAGYEGLLVDGFLNGLIRSGIRHIVDVRSNPVSRRYGFHKTTLSRLAAKVGIDYSHVPELGIVSQKRQDLSRPGVRDELFDEYASTTLLEEPQAISRVADLVVRAPSVLVCMEAKACECHRSRLAIPVSKETGLPIVHLDLRAA